MGFHVTKMTYHMKTTPKNYRSFLLFVLLFLILELPIGFGKSSLRNLAEKKSDNLMHATLYHELSLDSMGLSQQAFMAAFNGFEKLRQQGKLVQDNILTIIDFTRSSTDKRLFTIDLLSGKVLFNTYVAHGVNSGKEFAEKFSNIPSSLQSSLGFYETTTTYNGKHGYSLQLKGLEKGVNDNADKRAIVVHGAAYVSEGFIRAQGFLGRSWGCPALPEKETKPIIDKIKNGTCLFIYANDKHYLSHSEWLKS